MWFHLHRVQAATMEGGQLRLKNLSDLQAQVLSDTSTEGRLESLEQKFQQILSFLVKLDIQVPTVMLKFMLIMNPQITPAPASAPAPAGDEL